MLRIDCHQSGGARGRCSLKDRESSSPTVAPPLSFAFNLASDYRLVESSMPPVSVMPISAYWVIKPSAGLCRVAAVVISASARGGTCGLGIIWPNFREGVEYGPWELGRIKISARLERCTSSLLRPRCLRELWRARHLPGHQNVSPLERSVRPFLI